MIMKSCYCRARCALRSSHSAAVLHCLHSWAFSLGRINVCVCSCCCCILALVSTGPLSCLCMTYFSVARDITRCFLISWIADRFSGNPSQHQCGDIFHGAHRDWPASGLTSEESTLLPEFVCDSHLVHSLQSASLQRTVDKLWLCILRHKDEAHGRGDRGLLWPSAHYILGFGPRLSSREGRQ